MKSTHLKVPGLLVATTWKSSLVSVLFLSLTACGPGDQVEIETHRDITRSYGHAEVGATSEDRFGERKAPKQEAQHNHDTSTPSNSAATAAPLVWEVPDGWESKPPTSLRLANLVPAGDPRAECTLTLLGGAGGGELSNINRWRGQMGLAPIDQAALDAIPTMKVLGYDAPYFQLDGAYSGMGGGEAKPDWSMLGLILSREQFTIFVKMNGPRELVNAERDNFMAFCASLHEPSSSPAPPTAEVTGGTQAKGFVMPHGWRMGPKKSMRTLNLLAGESSECYLILLGGEAGGLEANINRWVGEVGLPAMTSAEIAALPTVKLFGVDAPMLEVSGDYKGMGSNDGIGRTVLGVALVRASGSAFVKMVGPAEEIAMEKQHFIELVESLEE